MRMEAGRSLTRGSVPARVGRGATALSQRGRRRRGEVARAAARRRGARGIGSQRHGSASAGDAGGSDPTGARRWLRPTARWPCTARDPVADDAPDVDRVELGIHAASGRRPRATGRGRAEVRARRARAGCHVAAMSSSPDQTPTATPATNAAPSAVASRTGEISTGRCVASASACTNVGLSVIPPSTRTRGDRDPACRPRPRRRGRRRGARSPSSTARTISARPVPRVRPNSAPRAP